MKFDVIVGNPPYQVMDQGENISSATPIYNKFVDLSVNLRPLNVVIIIPSKWMKGGKGLNKFRQNMMNDTRISHLVDFEDEAEVFNSVEISGGVCYFLWNKDYKGKVNYIHHSLNGEVDKSTRYLKNPFTSNVVRDSRQININKKAGAAGEFFDSIVSPRKPFGLGTNFFTPGKHEGVTVYNEYEGDLVAIHYVSDKGRAIKYIRLEDIPRAQESVDKYKLFFSKAYNYKMTVPPEVILGQPGTASTETFLKIGDFDTEEEMNNCLTYIKTKFFRALLYYNKHSLSITKTTFELIPLLDFNKKWTDEELYRKYNLTQKEIDYIEDNIATMK